MSSALDVHVIDSTPCGFEGIVTIPARGGVLIAQAKGKDSSNGNWTGVTLKVTELDTGAFRSSYGQDGSELVTLPMIIRERGRYRIQAIQSNFHETCEFTTVAGRVLEANFFD